MRNAREMSEKILTLKGIMSPDLLAILESIEDPGHLADLVAANLRLKIDEAQMCWRKWIHPQSHQGQ